MVLLPHGCDRGQHVGQHLRSFNAFCHLYGLSWAGERLPVIRRCGMRTTHPLKAALGS